MSDMRQPGHKSAGPLRVHCDNPFTGTSDVASSFRTAKWPLENMIAKVRSNEGGNRRRKGRKAEITLLASRLWRRARNERTFAGARRRDLRSLTPYLRPV
jgi:hypothetical protein